jgi:Protein of unknown function (DUF1329)
MKHSNAGALAVMLAMGLICQSASAQAPTPAAVSSDATRTSAPASATANAPTLTPGLSINKSNVAAYDQYMPAGLEVAIEHGFTAHIVPTTRIDWSKGFTDATEQYSNQVGLDKNDYLTNYTAGMPFPNVVTTDPKAAIKIAYNWHMGPFMPDDFWLAPWGSFAYSDSEKPNTFKAKDDYSYICDQFTFLRYAHRTEIDPRPTMGSNSFGFEWKARCSAWSASLEGNTGEGSGIWLRFTDPRRADEFYGYDPMSRRVQREGGFGIQPNQNCRACHQPYWAYALPKTEAFTYRLLGTTAILGCLTAGTEPAGLIEGDDGMAMGEAGFQLRNAYILEMTPTDSSEKSLRTLVYIDTETYVWLAAEFFESNERTEIAFPLWRSHPAPAGGSLFDLAGEFYMASSRPAMSLRAEAHQMVGYTNHSVGAVPDDTAATVPTWFFRTLMPAHGGFDQKINTGDIPEAYFNPMSLSR